MLTLVILGIFTVSTGYMAFAIIRVLMFARMVKTRARTVSGPPVTVVKPISGLEVELLENLRTFCQQDYRSFQVVFGVQSPDDPAIPIVEQVISEHPDLDAELVIDDRIIGHNLKISNISNIVSQAKHEIIVISDSDIRVGPDYLSTVTAPFEQQSVGATTTLYTASSRGGWASKLAALFVNDWFLPSALIPLGFGPLKYCFGATIAVRRQALEKAGGFSALADYLADDYMLGKLVSDAGYCIAFVPYLPDNVTHEPSIGAAFTHELRWARTIRSLQPVGYTLSTVTEVVPISIFTSIALYLDGHTAWPALAPIAIALMLRAALHTAVSLGIHGGKAFMPWLIPFRDLFSFAVRLTSFCGSHVVWRGNAFTVMDDNRIQRPKADGENASMSSKPQDIHAPKTG